MKKIIFTVILVAIVAGAGTPLFSGMMMERTVRQSFSDINKMYADSGSGYAIEIQQYDRNYSSSRIEWKLRLGALKALYGIEDIVFIDYADHGFGKIVSKTSLEKNRWFMDFVNNRLDGKNPLDITTEYKISGDIQSTVVVNGFSLNEGGEVIHMMPGQMFVSMDRGLHNILSEMTWTGCAAPGKFRMDDLSINSRMKRISTFIWESDISFTVKNIKADNSEKEFELSNLKCDSTMDYDEKNHSLSLGMGYGVESIISGRDVIRDASVRIGLNRVDAGGYENFMTIYTRMMNDILNDAAAQQGGPDKLSGSIEKQMAGMGVQMVGAYEKFLKKGLEIQISDFRAQLPQGEIKGDVALSLKKDMTIAQFTPIILQPSAALDIFSLKSHVSIPSQLAGDARMLLSPVYPGMQTGLFLKSGENMIHKAETRDGKLFLNDKEVLLN